MRPPGKAAVARNDLRQRITAGEYEPGDRLPPIRELMALYDIRSVSDLQRVLTDLESEGLITRRHGGENLVRERRVVRRDLIAGLFLEYQRAAAGGGTGGFLEAATGESEVDVQTTYDTITAPRRVAEALDLNRDAQVLERTFRTTIDGEPHWVARSYLPVTTALAAGLTSEEVERPGMETMTWLRTAGIVVDQAQISIGVRPPSAEEVRELSIPPGTAVFVFWRVNCSGGRPVEVSSAVVRGDKVEYHLDVDLTGCRR